MSVGPATSSLSEPDSIEELKSRLAAAENKLAWAELKIQVLEERLRLKRLEKYGPGSEKLSNLQLELLEEEPGVSQAEVEAESRLEAPAQPSNSKQRVSKLPEEKFDFLGYTFGRCYSPKTGRAYLGTIPAKKRVIRFCRAISNETGRNKTLLDIETVVATLKRV